MVSGRKIKRVRPSANTGSKAFGFAALVPPERGAGGRAGVVTRARRDVQGRMLTFAQRRDSHRPGAGWVQPAVLVINGRKLGTSRRRPPPLAHKVIWSSGINKRNSEAEAKVP